MLALSDVLANWNAFFGFLGTAAATLLGLLFVAVSLRLDIFRRPETADVRIFAGLTFTAFIGVLLSAGLSLVPHEEILVLTVPHVAVGLYGLIAIGYLAREWRRLNATSGTASPPQPGAGGEWLRGWVLGSLMGVAYLGLIGGSVLLLSAHPQTGLVVMAAADGMLLLLGTVNAWVMLGHAGGSASEPSASG